MWPALAVALLLTSPARARQTPATPQLPRQANELTAAGAHRVMARMLWAFGIADWRSAPLPVLMGDPPYREYRASAPATPDRDAWTLSIDSVSGALNVFALIAPDGAAIRVPAGATKPIATTATLRERALKIAALAPLPAGYTLRATDWFPRKITQGVDSYPDIDTGVSHEPAPESTSCEAQFAPDLPGRYPIDRRSTGFAPSAVLRFDVQTGRVTLAVARTRVLIVQRQVLVGAAAARRAADRYAAAYLRRDPDVLRHVPKGHDPCTKVALEYARLSGTFLDESAYVYGARLSMTGVQTIQLVWTVQYGALEIWINPTTGQQAGVA